jgi:hypothetical protein
MMKSSSHEGTKFLSAPSIAESNNHVEVLVVNLPFHLSLALFAN